MKYLKTYEDSPYERKIDYKYLNKEDAEEMEKFIIDFFVDSDFMEEIDNLKWVDFVEDDFNYRDMFDSITSSKYYTNGNVYYEVDNYCRNNKIRFSTPKFRNSVSNILEDIYNKYNPEFEDALDNKLIEILEKNPKKYKKKFNIYDDMFSDKVKDACQWMLDMRKYNL